MSQPPLLKNLAFDHILANVKLIAEAWDAGGLYQVGSFPSWNRWSEWNGKYRDDIRRFLKGDLGLANIVAERISGSHDLYYPIHRGYASVNFRKSHPVLKDSTKPALCGFPSSSKHGNLPWNTDLLEEKKTLGVMLAGRNEKDDKDDIIYIAINAYWEKQYVILPDLPKGLEWRTAVNTALSEGKDFVQGIDEMIKVGTKIELEPRSIMILCSIEIY